jgi:SAM-dependent methyltransferase
MRETIAVQADIQETAARQEAARAAWEGAFNAGSREERIARNRGITAYFNRLAAKQDPKTAPRDEFRAGVAAFLSREGIFGREDTVLDIGAGTGAYAFEFARNAREVTLMDMGETALDVARERAEILGLNNLCFVSSMWETFEPDRSFDLCFSAMCTGICTWKELQRMEGMSRKNCALITVAQGLGSPLRRTLRQRITPEPLPGLMAEGIYLFDLLYAMKRRPNVKMFRQRGVSSISAGEAFELYRIYYGAYGFSGEKTEGIIREFLDEFAPEGILQEETDTDFMLLYWKTPE